MNEKRSVRRLSVWALLGAAVLLAGLWPVSTRAQEGKLQTVKVGYIPLISYAAVFIAEEKGDFARQGLKVDLINFGSGAKMIPALAAGEIDVASGTSSAGLFNSIAEGMDFKIVADKGQNRPGYEYSTLVIRKDHLDSGRFKDFKDLAGMKVTTLPGRGVITEYMLYKILEFAGVPPEKVEIVDLAPPNQVKALASKSVDAMITAEPWGTVAENQGAGKIVPVGDVPGLKSLQVGMIMYSGKFIQEKPRAARGFMAAYLSGARIYNQKGLKDNEIANILFKYTKVKPELIKASVPFFLSNDGSMDLESIAAQQDLYLKKGYIKKKVPLAQAVDLQFLR